MNKLDQYLVDAVQNKPDACRVVVIRWLEPKTMWVSPDVFSKMKEFSDRSINIDPWESPCWIGGGSVAD